MIDNIIPLLNKINILPSEEEILTLLRYWLNDYDKIFKTIDYEFLIFLEHQQYDNSEIPLKIAELKQNISETYYYKQCLIDRVFSNQDYYKYFNKNHNLTPHFQKDKIN